LCRNIADRPKPITIAADGLFQGMAEFRRLFGQHRLGRA
jgi:hypothetical protein